MKLIIGLGNPGEQYELTRHNIGFAVVDSFAREHNLTWQTKNKFKAWIAEAFVEQEKVILLKPTTFYNLSGEAVQAVLHFYKVPLNEVLVVHDELALPFGVIRTRRGGSDAGNNGLKSIIGACGPDFARVRIGIANEQLARTDAADFVLNRFSAKEKTHLANIKKHAGQQLSAFIKETFDHATVKI